MKNYKSLFMMILLVGCLNQFASDIYAPALPEVAKLFGAPISLAQFSLAVYMLGVAISLLFYGPLSEGLGRKLPLIIGLSIMLLGSIICLLATTIYVLILGRALQGLGAGSAAGLWRAIFRDIFTGDTLAKYGSYFAVFVMFIVPAAPLLGANLMHYFSWQAIFIFISIYTLMTIILLFTNFTETSKHHNKNRLKISYVVTTYKTLLTSRLFVGITCTTFLSYGALFSWFVASPILLIHIVDISPISYGLLNFFGGGVAYALAGWLNGRFVTIFGMAKMMQFGFATMLLSGILLLVGKLLIGVNLWSIMIPGIVFFFGSTFIWPNAFATAMTPFGEIAGYAGSLYSFMQIAGAAIIGSLVAYLPTTNQIPLSMVFIISSLLAWLVYKKIVVSDANDANLS